MEIPDFRPFAAKYSKCTDSHSVHNRDRNLQSVAYMQYYRLIFAPAHTQDITVSLFPRLLKYGCCWRMYYCTNKNDIYCGTQWHSINLFQKLINGFTNNQLFQSLISYNTQQNMLIYFEHKTDSIFIPRSGSTGLFPKKHQFQFQDEAFNRLFRWRYSPPRDTIESYIIAILQTFHQLFT